MRTQIYINRLLRVEVLLRRGYCARLLEFQTFHFLCAVLDIWDEAGAVILKQRYGSRMGRGKYLWWGDKYKSNLITLTNERPRTVAV